MTAESISSSADAIVELSGAFETQATALGCQILRASVDGLIPALEPLAGSEWAGVGISEDVRGLMPGLASLLRPVDGWPEVAIGRAMFGIAATGSVVLAETNHRDRLMAQLCVRHIVLLPAAALVASLPAAAPYLQAWIQAGTRRYVTFASGPSRTSDIERVLTIGVHGPRELVIVLVDGWDPGDA